MALKGVAKAARSGRRHSSYGAAGGAAAGGPASRRQKKQPWRSLSKGAAAAAGAAPLQRRGGAAVPVFPPPPTPGTPRTGSLSLHRCAFTEWPISGGTAAAGVTLPGGGGALIAVGRANGVVEVRSSALGWGTLAALPAPPVEGTTVGLRVRGGRGGDGLAGQLDGAGPAVVSALAWAPTPVGVLLWAARRDGSLSLLRVGGGG